MAEGAKCCVCGGGNASPRMGHKTPFCKECYQDWEKSVEYARMTTARNDYVIRRRKELGRC